MRPENLVAARPLPEGSRGEPEQRQPFKKGIYHLAQRRPDVPIIPVCLRRLGIVLPKGARVPVPLFCDAVVGPPVIDRPSDADAFIHSLEKTMSRLRAIADHGVG